MNLRLDHPRTRTLVRAALLALAALSMLASRAQAEVAPATTLDGPSAAILDVDGAALADDGSGGVLYRTQVGGQPHLFVSRYQDGHWLAPIQADAGQPFGASFPTIAAGSGGRLLVVWAEPYATVDQATHYELMSAVLDPGAEGFGPAVQVDSNDIGDGSAAYPSLSMAPDGQAYLVYRVVTNTLANANGSNVGPLRPGDELIDVRVASFNGLSWSSLGTVNNFPQLSMRRPTASNAPQIGITPTGSAVVVWQEPDSSGTARIWARRVFGTTLGLVLQVSPTSAGGRPIDADADAPALAVGPFGEARVAYRLRGGTGSPFGNSRMFLNDLPSTVDPRGSSFLGATSIDGGNTLGPPALSLDPAGSFRLAYTDDGNARLLSGSTTGNGAPTTLGAANGDPALSTVDPSGGGVSAWPARGGSGLPVVAVRQDYSAGYQTAQLSAPISGPLDGVSLGQSTLGDALIAFRQGPAGQSQVMATVTRAPPGGFTVDTPANWVKPSRLSISWDPAPEAVGAVRYRILVDGQPRSGVTYSTHTQLQAGGLGDGIRQLRVLAIDSAGQQTISGESALKVDGNPPQVQVRRLHGRQVRARIFDRQSGAVKRSASIAWGDGKRTNGALTASHRYARPGRYVIVVRSSDRVGNHRTAHLRVQVG